MTTIAYKDGIIAYDSRVTRSWMIVDDNEEKMEIVKGHYFFYTGETDAHEQLKACYFGGKAKSQVKCNAMVYDSNKKTIKIIGVDDDTGLIWATPIHQRSCEATGSGEKHAFTAMDMGASAYEAVNITMKRDLCTGGKIRTVDINEI